MIRLKKMHIAKFRHIVNQDIEFGDALTVISGLNGTGKSSILGLAGHIFTDVDRNQKSLLNSKFSTEQKEVFRLCPIYDYNNVYEYTSDLDNNGNEEIVNVKTRHIKNDKTDRLKFDINGRKNKIKYPVLYLGLKRLFPNANESKFATKIDKQLTESDKKFYINEIENIMVISDNFNDVERVTTKNKNYLGIKTEKFGGAGNSAGQDNISQIITAIMSFKRFRNDGGILLIDELEATLFPAAQINLINKLYGYSKAYNLQIIFTTHSLEIIKTLYDKKYDDVKINFLELSNNQVVNKINPDFDYIMHTIRVEAKDIKQSNHKKHIVCEDELAALWIKGLIRGNTVSKSIDINYKEMNDGCIKKLAESRLSCFNDFIFVLDGDCETKKDYDKIKNVVFLPGNRPPEVVMYNYLNSLTDDDEIWKNDSFFTKNVCFNGFIGKKDLASCKKWFSKNKKYFGRGLNIFFKRWKKDNSKLHEEFIQKLNKFL